MLEAIYAHFSQPSKNKKLYEMQGNLGLNKGNLLRICDTRWVCRYKNYVVMLNNYSSMFNILDDEIEEQTDKDVARALDIIIGLSFNTFFFNIGTFIKLNKIITMFTFLIYRYFKLY